MAFDIPYATGPSSPHHAPQIWLQLNGSVPRPFAMNTASREARPRIAPPLDAAGGYLSYRWNGRLSNAFGGVTPGLAAR
jgi:hypothetical protein